MTSIRRLGWTVLALFALVGCEPATPPATPTPTTEPGPATAEPKAPTETKSMPVEAPKAEEPKGAAVKKLSDDEIAEIKKLLADDQAIALAQVTCPVGGDNLGEMGVPIKQVVDGKTFFLCCAGCEKAVKADPAGVLAKLKK